MSLLVVIVMVGHYQLLSIALVHPGVEEQKINRGNEDRLSISKMGKENYARKQTEKEQKRSLMRKQSVRMCGLNALMHRCERVHLAEYMRHVEIF